MELDYLWSSLALDDVYDTKEEMMKNDGVCYSE